MHHIPAHQTAVTLFWRTGEVECFATLQAALKTLGIHWIRTHVGREFREFTHVERRYNPDSGEYLYQRCYAEHDFIMRDDVGNAVTAITFDPLIARRRPRIWGYRIPDAWNGEGPVPGIRAWRGGRHHYRRIQTTAERRWATPVREEGEPAPRAQRNLRNLPNNWDDYRISAREDRNWKRFRRQQYRA